MVKTGGGKWWVTYWDIGNLALFSHQICTTCTCKLFNGNFGKPALSEPTGLLSITLLIKKCVKIKSCWFVQWKSSRNFVKILQYFELIPRSFWEATESRRKSTGRSSPPAPEGSHDSAGGCGHADRWGAGPVAGEWVGYHWPITSCFYLQLGHRGCSSV